MENLDQIEGKHFSFFKAVNGKTYAGPTVCKTDPKCKVVIREDDSNYLDYVIKNSDPIVYQEVKSSLPIWDKYMYNKLIEEGTLDALYNTSV
jgi:hypothetical protein